MIHWIKFFLNGVLETSKKGVETFQELLTLRNKCESKLLNLGRRAEKARSLLVFLYSNPVITTRDVQNLLGVGHKPAGNLIKALTNLGILEPIPGRLRNRLFWFKEYLTVFEVFKEE